MTTPDLVFQISGGAIPSAETGRILEIEEAVERSKRIAWCYANARIYSQPPLLEISVRVKVVSDYTPRSVVNSVNKVLCEHAYGQRLFTAERPGIVSLIEPLELLPTLRQLP